MTPYTLTDAEHDLRHAFTTGDPDTIHTATAHVDRLDTPTPAAPLGAAALWYAEHGIAVFPLQPGTKIPFKRSRGCKDATTDPDQIRTWWATTPDANIGVATGTTPTGGVDVVDIDGHIGQRSRLDNWPIFDQLPVIAKVTTPRPGGMHLYVPATDRGNKAGLLPGIDYRGTGGYVVAPPSVTDQGAYRFLATPALNRATVAA